MAGASPATTIYDESACEGSIVVAGLAPAIMLTNEPFMAMLYYARTACNSTGDISDEVL
jgi:hypothetical protein